MSWRKETTDAVDGEVSLDPEGEDAQGEGIGEFLVTLAVAFAIAFAIRGFVIEPFRIPSGSMFPTLLIGDHLFVNKFVYGPRIPFTDIRLPGLREPERGDVVVFEVGRLTDAPPGRDIVPIDRRPDARREDFVKRIVGLPGDLIEVRDEQLFVNHEPVSAVPLDRTFIDPQNTELDVYEETLGECMHGVVDDPGKATTGRTPFVVEEGRYFMMGDNRDNSNDSRVWGTVRIEEFKGPAFIIYWSWNSKGNFFHLLNPINWFTVEKRWDRVFDLIRCGAVDRVTRAGG
ncbi:MAG: signal peptidase I [Myxococcota bacterium]|jgi:signal peptidase I|nr:signal peptidase I [Myxococcota bacterium]